MPNRAGTSNRPGTPGRTGSFNRQVHPNRTGDPNNTRGNFRQSNPVRQSDLNKPGAKFNGQKPSGIRKPVSPNELLQLQKTNNSEKDKVSIKNNENSFFFLKPFEHLIHCTFDSLHV